MPIASAASKQALNPSAEQSIPPFKNNGGRCSGLARAVHNLQLTPSQTAITETAFGRSFISRSTRHGGPDEGGSLNSQRYSIVTGMRPPPRGRAIDLRYS